jgi:ubiquinone/menaquinone biosynthesis C-methylase UbiE
VASRFGQHTDNSAKYEDTGAVERYLLDRFRTRLIAELRGLAPTSVLDAGCGEGHVAAWIDESIHARELVGVDGRPEALARFRERNPSREAIAADLRALPFEERRFDFVLCTEVLEHLPEPDSALRELCRVSSGHVFVTVPHEPFFRMGNLAAGKYVRRLGSTPGHVWTWSRRRFLELIAAQAEPLRWVSMFPWQGVLARPRGARPRSERG